MRRIKGRSLVKSRRIATKDIVCFFNLKIFYFFKNKFILVEITCESGFSQLFKACKFPMQNVGDSGVNATLFSNLVQELEQSTGKKFYIVFRPVLSADLAERRREDALRTVETVSNRPQLILSSLPNDSFEEIRKKCANYTPWNPPDDAVQILLGGPAYCNRYRSANTKRISRFEDIRNKFCKFIFFFKNNQNIKNIKFFNIKIF